LLKLRYRWGTLKVQGAAEAQQVSVLGGFSPARTVTAGHVTAASQSLEQMVSRYPLSKKKLHQVRDDPFIPRHLKLRWMREVETTLANAHKKGDRPNPYDVMIEAVKGHRDNFFRGRRIPIAEIEAHGGLVRHASIRRMWTSLKPTVQAKYRESMNVWIRKLKEDPSAFSPADFKAGTRVPGVWWSAHHDSGNIGFMVVEQLRLERKDYPSGAVRFFLPPQFAGLPNLRKPTAFDGMLFRKFAASPGSVWGIIPEDEAEGAGIREGVSKTFVEVSSTTALFVPPGPR
jgi:hypothetical protein